MNIIAMEAENVKAIKAIRIEPDGSAVVIGGRNRQGKSSILDAIEMALSGGKSIPDDPIRYGKKSARVILELGDIKVTRTFGKRGTRLVVENTDGTPLDGTPQAILTRLAGDRTFDAMRFARMSTAERTEELKRLVGLDFVAIDARSKEAYETRTHTNRELKKLEGQLAGMPIVADVPDAEVSVAELSAEYRDGVARNHQRAEGIDTVKRCEETIASLEKQLQAEKDRLVGLMQGELADPVDVESIQAKIDGAESANRRYRENIKRVEVVNARDKLQDESTSLTDTIKAAANEKASMLANADFPIDGLAIEDDVVTLHGTPFDQLSSFEQIKSSVAIGIAKNNKLKIMFIRDGSFLDPASLELIKSMAEEAGMQLWIERVSKGSECSVIIEDGEIINPAE